MCQRAIGDDRRPARDDAVEKVVYVALGYRGSGARAPRLAQLFLKDTLDLPRRLPTLLLPALHEGFYQFFDRLHLLCALDLHRVKAVMDLLQDLARAFARFIG